MRRLRNVQRIIGLENEGSTPLEHASNMNYKCKDCNNGVAAILETYVNKRKKKSICMKMRCSNCGHTSITGDLFKDDALQMLEDISNLLKVDLLEVNQEILKEFLQIEEDSDEEEDWKKG